MPITNVEVRLLEALISINICFWPHCAISFSVFVSTCKQLFSIFFSFYFHRRRRIFMCLLLLKWQSKLGPFLNHLHDSKGTHCWNCSYVIFYLFSVRSKANVSISRWTIFLLSYSMKYKLKHTTLMFCIDSLFSYVIK